jgi:predicted metal-dependent hydrolase
MQANWSIILSTARSEAVFGPPGREHPLIVRRSRQARRMRLSVDPRNGAVTLSLPWRASLKPALRWADDQWPWVESALAKLPQPSPIQPGGYFPFEGELLLVDWREGLPRTIHHQPGRLVFGGPRDAVTSRVVAWAKRRAADVLTRETLEIASEADVTIGRIGIGDPRARWGSCAVNGDIRYSWRLIMAPAFVRRSTVAHEVAHRVHMDHSPAFHALAARLYGGDPDEAREWLRANGSALHWVGRALS